MQTAVFDTKPNDRESLQHDSAGLDIEGRFMGWRLSLPDTALT